MKSNRLEQLSDGIFAIVMTILVFDLKVPEIAGSALTTLAFCYQVGLGVVRDRKKANELYSQAVKKGQLGALWDSLIHYKHAPSADRKRALEFYKTLETPFPTLLRLECERIACFAYLCEYGAPYFDQDLFKAYRKYKIASEHDIKVQEEHSRCCAKERAYAKEKIRSFLPLYQFCRELTDIHKQLGFKDAINPEKEGSRGIIASLITQYAFEPDQEAPTLNSPLFRVLRHFKWS